MGLLIRRHKKVKEPIQQESVSPVKKEIKEDKFPKHVGGGWYELANGERVQGKEEAFKEEGE